MIIENILPLFYNNTLFTDNNIIKHAQYQSSIVINSILKTVTFHFTTRNRTLTRSVISVSFLSYFQHIYSTNTANIWWCLAFKVRCYGIVFSYFCCHCSNTRSILMHIKANTILSLKNVSLDLKITTTCHFKSVL